MKKDYYIIIVVKKQQKNKVLKESYDLLVDFDDLSILERKLPLPPQ